MSQELKQALSALNQELDHHPQLDQEEKAALIKLTNKIHLELDQFDDPNHPSDKVNLAPQASDLEVIMTKLSAEHPALTKVVKRIADGLSGMGN